MLDDIDRIQLRDCRVAKLVAILRAFGQQEWASF